MTGGLEGGSLSFDRAADYYDDTRGDTDEVERSSALLADQLPAEGQILEVGVGTGRMALPLHRRGFEIVGVDLSRRMMDKLLLKNGGTPPFPLAQADATRLPFADASFAAVYSIWVLHLIPAWEQAIDEVIRVLQPHGSFTVALGGQFGAGAWEEIAMKFRSLTGAENVGAKSIGEVSDAMSTRRWVGRELPPFKVEHEVTPAEVIRRLEEGCYSFTWLVDEQTRREAAAATRSWAERRYGDLDTPRPNEFGAVWRRYDRA